MSDFEPRGDRMIIHCYFEEEARQHQDYLEEEERLRLLEQEALSEEYQLQLHDNQ